jgi:replication factor C subunit 3/5
MLHKYSPWVEKYRPNNFDDIVLEKTNKKLLMNIINTNNFPNLLFYGPPGTGKTTTIINLINKYQEKNNQKRKDLKIHLNASDDRGIDIIRNQIFQFVNTKTLFGNGTKFVILDEVDYMTKNAQQALRYLIQQYSKDIRFCLICNYISRIDNSLQNEFVRLRFCQLPKKDIYSFLKNISIKENIHLKDKQIKDIQEYFKSDIRSMINYIQSNYNDCSLNTYIIEKSFWKTLIKKIKNKNNDIIKYVKNKSIYYNIQIKNLLMKFIMYLINNKLIDINNNKKFLDFIYYIVHNTTANDNYLLNYTIYYLEDIIISL